VRSASWCRRWHCSQPGERGSVTTPEPEPLTSQETQVALHAAKGMSNKEMNP
jgi:DNA-binding NarL/FixJ family response regulator